jgi:glyceraldehyde 3-phosphate dehydrogenase
LDNKFIAYNDYIQNQNTIIKILNYDNLTKIDYEKYKIDFVIDASGSKIDILNLKQLSPKAFFLTHPLKNADINVVLGVNDNLLNLSKQKIISTSSCNATALLPVLKLIDDNYKIICGDISTIHPLLNHQKTLDSGCIGSKHRDIKCNFEFGRSSLQNIIPSATTTVDACSMSINHFNSDLLSSNSFRVPTSTVGAINVILYIDKPVSKDELILLCQEYAKVQKYNIILNNFEPLVSSDFQAQDFTTIIDHRFTDIKQGKMIKLVLWYDNEWGYASKVVDIVSKAI